MWVYVFYGEFLSSICALPQMFMILFTSVMCSLPLNILTVKCFILTWYKFLSQTIGSYFSCQKLEHNYWLEEQCHTTMKNSQTSRNATETVPVLRKRANIYIWNRDVFGNLFIIKCATLWKRCNAMKQRYSSENGLFMRCDITTKNTVYVHIHAFVNIGQ